MPSASSVTRFSGFGRSSVVSQKSTACSAVSARLQSRRQLRELGLLALHRRRVRLADHLDVADGPVVVVGAEVEVVDRERLLEDRLVELLRAARRLPCCCGTCSCGRPGRSRWRGRSDAGRSPSAAGSWRCSRRRRRRRRRRALYCSSFPPRVTTTFVTERPDASVSSRVTSASTSSVTFGIAEQRSHRDGLRVGLGVHEARIAVAPRAADAGAPRAVGFVEQDPARCVERVVPAVLQVVDELLDARLVRHGRPRVLLAPVPLGRVFAVIAVHLVEPLRLGVVGLEVVVRDRPRRRHARRRAAAHRSPGVGVGTTRRRTSSSHHRRSSAPAAGTRCRRSRTTCQPRCNARRRTPGRDPSSPSRAAGSRRVRAAGSAFPDGASVCASVPPPAPVPMMITSKCSGMFRPLPPRT